MSRDSDDTPARIEGQPNDRPNEGRNRTATDERGGKPLRGREDADEDDEDHSRFSMNIDDFASI